MVGALKLRKSTNFIMEDTTDTLIVIIYIGKNN